MVVARTVRRDAPYGSGLVGVGPGWLVVERSEPPDVCLPRRKVFSSGLRRKVRRDAAYF